jgi:hypothetical protein
MVTTNKDLIFLAKNACDKPSDQMEASALSCSLISIKECFVELYLRVVKFKKKMSICT